MTTYQESLDEILAYIHKKETFSVAEIQQDLRYPPGLCDDLIYTLEKGGYIIKVDGYGGLFYTMTMAGNHFHLNGGYAAWMKVDRREQRWKMVKQVAAVLNIVLTLAVAAWGAYAASRKDPVFIVLPAKAGQEVIKVDY